ncbi:MAG TPA: efflux RND transporter periplasmic adaptor subunit [Syntrophorhabdales bacterium]|nr:efflux RND transporter periplasmic adaptor subunit [Syntrophorhabdales bacterium]
MSRFPRKRTVQFCALIVIFGLGIALGLRLDRSLGGALAQGATEPPAAFMRQDDRIVIPPGSALRAQLAMEQVTVKDTPRTLVLPASVEADPARTINILPPVTGRVVALKVSLGDRVVKGQPLIVIDSADLAQAYADDDKARGVLEHTRKVMERVRGLNKTGAGALKDLEQAECDYEQARIEFGRAEARLREIGVQPGKGESRLLTLKAPAEGSVTALMCAPGAFANDTTAALMTVASLDTVWVTANVPESDVAHVAKGQSVDVTFPAYPGKTLHGKVAFVSDVMDSDSRRCKVRMTFANLDRKLKPNMFANASFNVPQKDMVFVPNSALLMNNDSTVVFVEIEPWTFVRRPVVPGYGEGDGARIEQGLNPGDRVIVKGGVLLND